MRAIVPTHTRGAVRESRQARGGGVPPRRTGDGRATGLWAVVSRRTDVIRGVVTARAGLSHITQLVAGLGALMRSGESAAISTEIPTKAGPCWFGQTRRSAVVTRRACCALLDILQIRAITEGSVRTQELLGESRVHGAVAAGGAVHWGCGVELAVVTVSAHLH